MSTKDYANATYLVGQDGSASFNGAWFDASLVEVITMNVWWTAFAATAGTLVLQGSNDYTQSQAINPNANSIVDLTVAAPTGGNTTGLFGTQPAAGAAGGIVLVHFVPTRLIRLKYTRSAGGTTGQFSAAWHGRGT